MKKLRWNPKGVVASLVSESIKAMVSTDPANALANMAVGGVSAVINGFSIQDTSTPVSKYISVIERIIRDTIETSIEVELEVLNDLVEAIVSVEVIDLSLSDKDRLSLCIKKSFASNKVYLDDISETFIDGIAEDILIAIRNAIESEVDLLVYETHKLVRSIDSRMKNSEIEVPEKTRFDENINEMDIFNILSDYCEYDDVRPIVSYGIQKDLQIIQNYNSFEMMLDIKDSTLFGRQEFVMALLKYSPSEDFSAFWKNNYELEFDISSSSGIHAVQLEIKDENYNKIVDKRICIQTQQRFLLSRLTRKDNSWKKVSEICFTIFLNEDYLSVSAGKIVVSNLLLKPAS